MGGREHLAKGRAAQQARLFHDGIGMAQVRILRMRHPVEPPAQDGRVGRRGGQDAVQQVVLRQGAVLGEPEGENLKGYQIVREQEDARILGGQDALIHAREEFFVGPAHDLILRRPAAARIEDHRQLECGVHLQRERHRILQGANHHQHVGLVESVGVIGTNLVHDGSIVEDRAFNLLPEMRPGTLDGDLPGHVTFEMQLLQPLPVLPGVAGVQQIQGRRFPVDQPLEDAQGKFLLGRG